MLLAVDVGNSNTSLGVFEGDRLRCELRLSTSPNWTRDEVAIAFERALALQGYGYAAVSAAVIACVVPAALGPLVEALERYGRMSEVLVVGPGVKTGMPVLYDPPKDVGADRIVAAIAAHELYSLWPDAGERTEPAPKGLQPSESAAHGLKPSESAPHGLIVVDFGTATTFDVVSPKPEYLGGAIAPGVGISADALFQRAAKLPRVDVIKPESVVGRNTVAAIQSGLFYGYVGMVEGMLARIRSTLDWPTRVVATGGLARKIAPETDAIDVVDDNLMLEGLRLIWQRNRT
jgi:type III pantothenate kinase